MITFENIDEIDHLVNIFHENSKTISIDEIKMELTCFFAGNKHLSPYMVFEISIKRCKQNDILLFLSNNMSSPPCGNRASCPCISRTNTNANTMVNGYLSNIEYFV